MEVLTTVWGGTERRMSAPDDYAVLGSHQFLDVVTLHVKVGIAPAACPVAPSTVKADEDRYKGSAYLGYRQDRKLSTRIANTVNHSARLARAVAPEVRRGHAPGSHTSRVRGLDRASRLTSYRSLTGGCRGYFGNIARVTAMQPRLRAICSPSSFNHHAFDEIRKQASRAGGMRTSKSKRDLNMLRLLACARDWQYRSIACDRARIRLIQSRTNRIWRRHKSR